MAEKPTTAAGYTSEQTARVRAVCLYVATKLGDLMDELVVVGGLVPSLLVPEEALDGQTQTHVGTMDLDVGLAIALFDEARYRTLTDRLRRADFSPDVNDEGNETRQRWKTDTDGKVTIDFLVSPTAPTDVGGKIKDIEHDFAAIIAPGLHLAFRDRRKIPLTSRTVKGEEATRDIWVCGPGAYVVLKALAFDSRGENKDAYDLYYVVRNYGSGVGDVAACLRPFVDDDAAAGAIAILRRDFLDHNSVGPRRVAEFMTGGPDDAIQADVVGFFGELVARCS